MNVDVRVSPWQHVNGISDRPMEAHRAHSAPAPGFCHLGARRCWWVGSAKVRPGVTEPPHICFPSCDGRAVKSFIVLWEHRAGLTREDAMKSSGRRSVCAPLKTTLVSRRTPEQNQVPP